MICLIFGPINRLCIPAQMFFIKSDIVYIKKTVYNSIKKKKDAKMNLQSNEVKYIRQIPINPDINMVLSRLGYRKNVTVLDEGSSEFIEKALNEAAKLCSISAAYAIFRVISRNDEFVELQQQIAFQSSGLAGLLKNSTYAVLMSSTAGSEVMEAIDSEIKKGNAAKALIIDSYASQAADKGLDWLKVFLNRMLLRTGMKLTKHRFSPGYGDLEIYYQKIIYEVLKLDRLNISITEKYMLVPEKSVIAIAGIEKADI